MTSSPDLQNFSRTGPANPIESIYQLCAGKTNKEISRALFISLQTVKDHIYRIYLKTNVKNRVQLINLIQVYGSDDGNSPKES